MRAKSFILKTPIRHFIFFLIAAIAISGCRKDRDNQDLPPSTAPELSKIRFSGFTLKETAAISTDIIHPVIENGKQVQDGSINIVVPFAHNDLQLTPESNNLNLDSFKVEPALGTKQNFKSKQVVYTVSSKHHSTVKVSYKVSITAEQDPASADPKLTSLKFRTADNPRFPDDINAERIVHGEGTMGKVYIFVPGGTDFTKLQAAISFQGAQAVYSQDPNEVPQNSNLVYPVEGKMIDCKYPKAFYLTIKSSGRSKTYDVIVDVKKPAAFIASSVVTGNVKPGVIEKFHVTDMLNIGNHPISIAQVKHTDNPAGGVAPTRAYTVIPANGVLPGQRVEVMTTVNSNGFPAGNYETTALFYPKLFREADTENLFQPATIRVSTTILQ